MNYTIEFVDKELVNNLIADLMGFLVRFWSSFSVLELNFIKHGMVVLPFYFVFKG